MLRRWPRAAARRAVGRAAASAATSAMFPAPVRCTSVAEGRRLDEIDRAVGRVAASAATSAMFAAPVRCYVGGGGAAARRDRPSGRPRRGERSDISDVRCRPDEADLPVEGASGARCRATVKQRRREYVDQRTSLRSLLTLAGPG
jgi:hypothetical protein